MGNKENIQKGMPFLALYQERAGKFSLDYKYSQTLTLRPA